MHLVSAPCAQKRLAQKPGAAKNRDFHRLQLRRSVKKFGPDSPRTSRKFPHRAEQRRADPWRTRWVRLPAPSLSSAADHSKSACAHEPERKNQSPCKAPALARTSRRIRGQSPTGSTACVCFRTTAAPLPIAQMRENSGAGQRQHPEFLLPPHELVFLAPVSADSAIPAKRCGTNWNDCPAQILQESRPLPWSAGCNSRKKIPVRRRTRAVPE